MDKILTKKILTKINDYISSESSTISKAEKRCLKDMSLGMLKSKSVFVNQIASSLREDKKLKDVAKRLSSQYLKDDYASKIQEFHLENVSASVSKNDFIVMDGTDISKKHAKFMEGLEFVKNGDTGEIGLGYNILNITAISSDKTITPLSSRAYSYQMGALSSNHEIKKSVNQVKEHIQNKGCWVFDRGADTQILKDFFFKNCSKCIIRLKKNSKLSYNQQELRVDQLVNKVIFHQTQSVIKVKKNKKVKKEYELGALPVSYFIRGVEIKLWLVVSRQKTTGGCCYLLVKTDKNNPIDIASWAFKGYGLRWKIEEYHRHIKQSYQLESTQMKTFNGLQSSIVILMIASCFIYKKLKAIHFDLLLDSGYNLLNKHTVDELINFIYYKISTIVANLLTPVRIRWKINHSTTTSNQLTLTF